MAVVSSEKQGHFFKVEAGKKANDKDKTNKTEMKTKK